MSPHGGKRRSDGSPWHTGFRWGRVELRAGTIVGCRLQSFGGAVSAVPA